MKLVTSSFVAIATAFGLITSVSSAETIISTDFSGRTFTGNVASDITYTTTGVQDPGDLTVVENEGNNVNDGSTELTGFFDTPASAGYFAPDLNVDNEDGWYVDVALTFATGITTINIESLDFSVNHFDNNGNGQANNSTNGSNWSAELIGSVTGVVASGSVTNLGNQYVNGPFSDSFDMSATLGNTESWTLRIYSDYDTAGAGNNAGLDSFTLNGTTVIPEPSSAILLTLAGCAMIARRRR